MKIDTLIQLFNEWLVLENPTKEQNIYYASTVLKFMYTLDARLQALESERHTSITVNM